MPKQISVRKVLWLSMMLAWSMVMPALPSQAQWEPQAISEASCAPDSGTAKITGKVTGNGGVALQNVQVTAFTLTGHRGGVANTNASGVYTITNLIGSNYLISFDPRFNPGPYVLEWYGDKPTPANATPVLVNTGSTVANINNQLPAGGQISGLVQGAGPLQSVQVMVYDSAGNSVATGTTNAAGVYTTTPGLAAGTYRVQFAGVSGFLDQYYNGKNALGTADPVLVAGPGIVGNINATLARGGAITGKVTRAGSGTPVVSADVSAFGNAGSGFGFTNASGDFTVQGLPSGVYQVEVSASDLVSARQTITVTAPNTTTNTNSALAVGGVITGRVVNAASVPLNGITVYISNQDGSYQEYVSTNSNGIYKATGLPTGQYTAFFRPSQFIPEVYNNKVTGTPDVINVTAPFTVTNINASLDKGAVISGTVTDAQTGLPIEKVFVEVLDADGGRVETDFTDAVGKYEMPSTLATGNYKVRFNADERFASCAYVTEYNNDKLTLESADLIAVTAPNTHIINAALSRGSIIFGRVIDANTGAPVTNGFIRVYDAAGKNVMFGRLTFLGGYHTQTALPGGSYRVEFTDDAGGYIDEFWKDKPSLASADSVNLIAPNDAGNINFDVVKGGTISGKVIASDTGLPFTQGSIQVYDANGTAVGFAGIDPDGTYRVMNGLPTGNYRVGVVPYGFDGVAMAHLEDAAPMDALEIRAEAAPADSFTPATFGESEIVTEAQAEVSDLTPAQPTPEVKPMRVVNPAQASAGVAFSSHLPTFFGGTVITGPANVAVTSPNNTADINITVKFGVLIPNVQR
jgi:5-hydroxyisourate hydrolase-like protein (transthyretin family)